MVLKPMWDGSLRAAFVGPYSVIKKIGGKSLALPTVEGRPDFAMLTF